GEVIEVQSGPVAELALPLLEQSRVHVHFQHDDGTPLVGRVTLEWGGWEGPGYVVATEYDRLRALQLELDAKGDADLDLFPATYSFHAREATVRRNVTLAVPRDPEATLTIRLPDRGPSGSIHVRLVDAASSQPLTFCKVRAIGGKRPSL